MAKSKGSKGGGGKPGGGNPAAGMMDMMGQVGDVLTKLVGTLKPFVEAISPSTIREFNQAIRDLQATIGSAFIGAFNILSSVIREISGILLPLMQRLEPIIRMLAEALGNTLIAAVTVVVAAMELLAPLIEIVAAGLQELSKFMLDLASLITAVFRVVRDLLSAFFGGGDFKEVFKSFFDMMRQVVKSLVIFAATLAVFAGFRETVKAFADGIAKEAKARDERVAGLKAAATNPAFQDVSAILKQAQLSAFTAAGGGAAREKSDTQWLQDIAKAVGDTAATRKSLGEALGEWWRTEVVGGPGILGKVLRFFDSIGDKITKFLNRF